MADMDYAVEIGLPKYNMQKHVNRKARKNKKRIDNANLSYYFDDAVAGPMNRLSDFGITGPDIAFSSQIQSRTSCGISYYENMEHLSAKERQKFESAFTVPKNPNK